MTRHRSVTKAQKFHKMKQRVHRTHRLRHAVSTTHKQTQLQGHLCGAALFFLSLDENNALKMCTQGVCSERIGFD